MTYGKATEGKNMRSDGENGSQDCQEKIAMTKVMAEIRPYFSLAEVDVDCSRLTKLSLGRVAAGAGIAAGFSEAFRTAVTSIDPGLSGAGGPGIYKVSFPDGVTGALAQFKDGSGYLGSIMGDGIVGQARLGSVEGVAATTVIPVDPMTLAVAVAVAGIDKKLDRVIELQDEIVDFLERDKKTQIEASLHALNGICDSYPHNWDDDHFVQAGLTRVMAEKREAKANILFYSGRLEDAFSKKDFVHFDFSTNGKLQKLQDDFGQYRLALYVYLYASFLEIALLKRFSKEYLSMVVSDMNDHVYQYRFVYTNCYNQLEQYSRRSVETFVKGGISGALKGLGGAIGKVPIIEKGPVDEVLSASGDLVGDMKESHAEEALSIFVGNRDCGAQPFIDAVEEVGRLCGEPIEILVDHEDVFLIDKN